MSGPPDIPFNFRPGRQQGHVLVTFHGQPAPVDVDMPLADWVALLRELPVIFEQELIAMDEAPQRQALLEWPIEAVRASLADDHQALILTGYSASRLAHHWRLPWKLVLRVCEELATKYNRWADRPAPPRH